VCVCVCVCVCVYVVACVYARATRESLARDVPRDKLTNSYGI